MAEKSRRILLLQDNPALYGICHEALGYYDLVELSLGEGLAELTELLPARLLVLDGMAAGWEGLLTDALATPDWETSILVVATEEQSARLRDLGLPSEVHIYDKPIDSAGVCACLADLLDDDEEDEGDEEAPGFEGAVKEDLEGGETPEGVGIQKVVERAERIDGESRGRSTSMGDVVYEEEVLIDPMTGEEISRTCVIDEDCRRVKDEFDEFLYNVNDRWFKLNAKFLWKDAPKEKEVKEEKTERRNRKSRKSRKSKKDDDK